jgi:hypothetical protein
MHVGRIAALQQHPQQQGGGTVLAVRGVAAYNARHWRCCLQLRRAVGPPIQ